MLIASDCRGDLSALRWEEVGEQSKSNQWTGTESVEVKKAASRSSTDNMDMDLKWVIEKLETGEQDTVLMALQSYNKEVKLCC